MILHTTFCVIYQLNSDLYLVLYGISYFLYCPTVSFRSLKKPAREVNAKRFISHYNIKNKSVQFEDFVTVPNYIWLNGAWKLQGAGR